jgi:hypothetical protein
MAASQISVLSALNAFVRFHTLRHALGPDMSARSSTRHGAYTFLLPRFLPRSREHTRHSTPLSTLMYSNSMPNTGLGSMWLA